MRIVAAVLESPFTRVTALAERFGVSEVTIRSDLDVLETDGEVRRVRGGAIGIKKHIHESTFEQSLEVESAAKLAIGELAAGMVRSGDTIIIDVGTTADALARRLVARDDLADVTVVTNGLNVALILEQALGPLTVLLTGGTLRGGQHSLVEPVGNQLLGSLNANLAFIGCSGVSLDHGVTNVNLSEATVKRSMIAAARRSVVLADHTKIGRTSVVRICTLDSVTDVVTSIGADERESANIRDTGVSLHIAQR